MKKQKNEENRGLGRWRGCISPSAIGNRFSLDASAWRFLRKGLGFRSAAESVFWEPRYEKSPPEGVPRAFSLKCLLELSVLARTWGGHPLFREAPPPITREDGKRVREGVLHFSCQGEDVFSDAPRF